MMRWISKLVRHSVALHLTDGQSIRGVLLAEHKDCLVLGQAGYLGTDGVTKVDGEVVVPRERISWMQVLTAPEVL